MSKMSYTCEKCNKHYKRIDHFDIHVRKCKGIKETIIQAKTTNQSVLPQISDFNNMFKKNMEELKNSNDISLQDLRKENSLKNEIKKKAAFANPATDKLNELKDETKTLNTISNNIKAKERLAKTTPKSINPLFDGTPIKNAIIDKAGTAIIDNYLDMSSSVIEKLTPMMIGYNKRVMKHSNLYTKPLLNMLNKRNITPKNLPDGVQLIGITSWDLSLTLMSNRKNGNESQITPKTKKNKKNKKNNNIGGNKFGF